MGHFFSAIRPRSAGRIIICAWLAALALHAADAPADPLIALARLRPDDGVAIVRAADLELRRSPPDPTGWEKRMLTGLADADATDFGCQTASMRLVRCATTASVPVVEPWLALPGRMHAARMVLEAVPGSEATAALVRALGSLSGNRRVPIIDSLGRRGDPAAVPAITPLASDGDALVAQAALLALGRIGDSAAIAALRAAPATDIRDEALLLAADRRGRNCEMDVARTLYRELADPARGSTRRGYALAALAGAGEGDLLIPILCDALVGTDKGLTAGAVRGLGLMPGATATVAIANRLADWPAEVQIIACGILAVRKDPVGADAAAGLLPSTVPGVRQAAIGVLAVCGNERHLDVLLSLTGDRTLGKSARAALAALVPRDVIDQALLARVKDADPVARAAILAILVDRHCHAVVPLLLHDARGDDAERAAQALTLLGDAAAPEDLPALFDLLDMRNGDGAVRDAIATLVRRHPDPTQAVTALDARWDAASPELKRSLVRLYGVTGRNLPRLRTALADPALADAALLAATEWPSATVAEDLAAAVRSCRNASLRLTGLRSLGRILELPDHPAHERSAQLLHLALGQTPTAEERRIFLAALANHPDDQSLEMAMELLHDAELKAEAQACILAMARTMAGTQSDKLRPALQKLKEGGDAAVQKEATRLLGKLDQP